MSVYQFAVLSADYRSGRRKQSAGKFHFRVYGYYSGSYTGDISGSLTVTVRKDATVEVTRSTAGNPDTYVTSLVMSSFNGVSQSPQGFMLIGNMQTKKGTWQQGNLKGTWAITKN